jgi:hypothetical protein
MKELKDVLQLSLHRFAAKDALVEVITAAIAASGCLCGLKVQNNKFQKDCKSHCPIPACTGLLGELPIVHCMSILLLAATFKIFVPFPVVV